MRVYGQILCIVLCSYIINNDAASGVIKVTINRAGRHILSQYQRIIATHFGNSFKPVPQKWLHMTLHHLQRYSEELIDAAMTVAETEEAIHCIVLENMVTLLNTPSNRIALVVRVDRSTTEGNNAANRLEYLVQQLRSAVDDLKILKRGRPTTLPFIPHVTLGFIASPTLSKRAVKRGLSGINPLLPSNERILMDVDALDIFRNRHLEKTIHLRG